MTAAACHTTRNVVALPCTSWNGTQHPLSTRKRNRFSLTHSPSTVDKHDSRTRPRTSTLLLLMRHRTSTTQPDKPVQSQCTSAQRRFEDPDQAPALQPQRVALQRSRASRLGPAKSTLLCVLELYCQTSLSQGLSIASIAVGQYKTT